MSLVNWHVFLPPSANVTFSTLAIPDFERDSLNRDIAEIVLESGWVIDVEWCVEAQEYVVTLYRDEFEDWLIQRPCDTASDVVILVKDLAEKYTAEDIWRSASSCDTSDPSIYDFQNA